MLSPNAKHNNFIFSFPENWFVDSICEKYNTYLKYQNGTISNIKDFVNESIQTVTLGSYSSEPLEQPKPTSNGKDSDYDADKRNQNNLVDDKSITITFVHKDSFLNYYCLFEHYLYYTKSNLEHKKLFHPVFNLLTTRMDGSVVFQNNLLKIRPINIDPLTYSYNELDNQFDTFTMIFKYADFDLKFNLPEPKINLK